MSKTFLKVTAKSDKEHKNPIKVDICISKIKWNSMSKRQQDKVIQQRLNYLFVVQVINEDAVLNG